MGLKNMQKNTRSNENRTPREGVIFRVDTTKGKGTKDEPLTLTGTALMGNDVAKENEEITVVMGDAFNEERSRVLMKTLGKKPGSTLVLDSCYRDGDVVRSNWANSITSQKEMDADPNSDHHSRSILSVVAQVPVMRLENKSHVKGEPETIVWRLNQDSIKVGDAEFDRNWLFEKVSAADNKDVKVYFDMFEPENSQVVTEQNQLTDIITDLVESGRSALIRAIDNEDGFALTRRSMSNQNNDAEQALSYLLDEGVMPRVDDETLFSEVAAGNITLEVMPMDRKYYVGDTKVSVMSGFTGNKSKQMIGSFGMGDNTRDLAQVYIPVQIQNAGQDDEWAMPLGAMVRGGAFAGDFQTMASPHFDGKAPEASAEAPAAEAPAAEGADLAPGLDDEPAFSAPSA